MKKLSMFLIPAIAFALSFGCISVSYNGKVYTPTVSVEVLKTQKDIPAGYELMGKAAVTAPSNNTSRKDLENRMIEKAKVSGADAIMIVDFQDVISGEERVDQFINTAPTNTGWGMDTGTQGDIGSINSTHIPASKASSSETPVFSYLMKAVFLKKKDAPAK